MVSRVWVINSVLAIALVICVANIRDVWHAPVQVISEKKSAVNEKAPVQKKKSPAIRELRASDYQSVVEKNLFSPDRAVAPPESGETETATPADVRISGEKVELYGVILADNFKKALINNPGGHKTGSRIQWVSEGDLLENLKVQKILEDEILLADGSKRYRVLLYDPDKAAKSSEKYSSKRTEEAQPQVISTGKTPTAKKQKTDKSNKPAENISTSSDDGYEIIDTPFGKIKRKRK